MSIPGVGLKTEIAFNAGYRTPAASRTWTDVSSKVELKDNISIGYGRRDELSMADANTLGLTLDNTDGRFTSGRSASLYAPNVRLGRPIRVTATVGGVDYVRYVGNVDEWPLEWPGGGDTYAAAGISASSRLARIGLSSPLKHTIDQATALTAPEHYWTLADPAGATTAADVGTEPAPMTVQRQVLAFGVGADGGDTTLGVDSRGAVLFTGINDTLNEPMMRADLPTPIVFGPGTPGGLTISLFAKVTNPDPAMLLTGQLAVLYNKATGFGFGASSGAKWVEFDTFAYNFVDNATGPSSAWPTDLGSFGGLHHLVVTVACDGTNTTVTGYQDGVLDLAQTVAAVAFNIDRAQLQGPPNFNTIVGRVALWDRALTATEIADLAEAGLTGYAGDTTDERLKRYATWEGIPSAELVTTASPITMASIQTDGTQTETLMRQVEDTEAGVLHDDRQNRLVLRRRNARYGKIVDLTLNTNTQDYGADYAPKVDRQGLVNYGKGTNTLGTVEVEYEDAASRFEYGDASYDVQTASEDPDEPLQLIAWQVSGHSEPRPRAPQVTINVLDWISNPTTLAKVLALDIGSRVQLTNAPTQAASSTGDYFVEGYSETFGEAAWSITLNLSPVIFEASLWTLDDPVLGQLDAGNVLAI